MRAILHVNVGELFNFERYVLRTLWPVNPHHFIPPQRKIKDKHLREDETNAYTIDGNKWTWTTRQGGNGIRLDDTFDDDGKRIVCVELCSRRIVLQGRDNALSVLIYNLEFESMVSRQNWKVKHFESSVDLPWYKINYKSDGHTTLGIDESTPYKNVILREVIERKIYDTYQSTSRVTPEMIERALRPDYGKKRVNMSKHHILNTLLYMKVRALIVQNDFTDTEHDDIFRFFDKYFEKDQMRYVGMLVNRLVIQKIKDIE